MRLENGIPLDDVAGSLCRVYQRALGKTAEPWELTEADIRAGFEHAALQVHASADGQDWQGQTWPEIAQAIFEAAVAPLRPDIERRWGDLTQLERCAWEAVARHAALLLDQEDARPQWDRLEAEWDGWAAKRLHFLERTLVV